ncbi:MAG: lasso peptide biosynthesis B2 protein [Pseudomonadota bacterium]
MTSHLGWQEASEAVAELTLARLVTLMPARIYTRLLQHQGEPHPADGADQALAIGQLIERVARHLPFRTLCLQQVIALRRMLGRRGLGCTVVLGIAPDQVGDAHAWLKVGETIVSGEDGVERFQVIAEFT